jgi:hypothetical protein
MKVATWGPGFVSAHAGNSLLNIQIAGKIDCSFQMQLPFMLWCLLC